MADLTSVRASIQAALDEADTALNQPTTAQQIAAAKASEDAANARLAKVQSALAALASAFDAFKAALNG